MSALYQLEHFGFLRVSGIDAVRFMQGYTTCNLEALGPGSVQMGAICNLQGRMLSSFLVIIDGQDLLFRMHRSRIEPSMAFLGKYIVFSKAELLDASDSLVCYGAPVPAESVPAATVETRDDRFIISLSNRQEQWVRAGVEVEAEPDPRPFMDAEVEAGIAWVDTASSEQYLPQMFNYDAIGAVDFTKGCYLGQEIVARAQYRGELKRRLHRLPAALPVQEIDGGAIVASASAASLAVLANSTADAIEVTVDGRTLEATPLK